MATVHVWNCYEEMTHIFAYNSPMQKKKISFLYVLHFGNVRRHKMEIRALSAKFANRTMVYIDPVIAKAQFRSILSRSIPSEKYR